MMRRVLVDHARSRKADKRGSGEAAVVLDEALEIANVPECRCRRRR
jgi:hypothetical protein